MPLILSIFYETTAGERCSAGAFQFDAATLTLRELIRVFVQQEVKRFNESKSEVFRGLVQPEESERILVLMEPGSRYLCIVEGAATKATPRSLLLPFEGDHKLSLILSKAFLLADDRKIKDETILRQLPPPLG
jgi:hypothetical protein